MNNIVNNIVNKNWTRYAAYAGVFGAVLALSGYMTYRVLGSTLTFEIPELAGRNMQEVESIIKDLPITVKVVGEEFDKNIVKGSVLDQSIAPGTAAKGTAVVELVLSKGVEVRLIPPVTGMTVEQARRTLKEKGIELSKVLRVHSNRAVEGLVVAQRPTPEEWTGEPIKVVASAGPYDVSYYCPDFTGMTREDAVLLALALGLGTDLKGAERGGTVAKQWPPQGTILRKGAAVALRTASSEVK